MQMGKQNTHRKEGPLIQVFLAFLNPYNMGKKTTDLLCHAGVFDDHRPAENNFQIHWL